MAKIYLFDKVVTLKNAISPCYEKVSFLAKNSFVLSPPRKSLTLLTFFVRVVRFHVKKNRKRQCSKKSDDIIAANTLENYSDKVSNYKTDDKVWTFFGS